MEKNLYHLSPDERKRLGIEQLPETLGEAIELTAESELVLRTFGEHIFNRYVEIKRQEWEDYRVQVTQWELDRYMSILLATLRTRRTPASSVGRSCRALSGLHCVLGLLGPHAAMRTDGAAAGPPRFAAGLFVRRVGHLATRDIALRA